MFIKKKKKKSSRKMALRFISRLQLGVTIREILTTAIVLQLVARILR